MIFFSVFIIKVPVLPMSASRYWLSGDWKPALWKSSQVLEVGACREFQGFM